MTATPPWDLPHYRIRRKLLKIFGASFHVYDGDRIVAFCKQKAFKLKEDIRLFTDESLSTELLWIRARQVIDFAASYDVVDSATQQKVGALRRRGFKSMLRDSWEVLDVDDQVIGKVEEDSMGMALLRRFLANIIPQKFHLTTGGGMTATMRQRFNPFIFSLEVDTPREFDLDKRMVFGAAVLLAAIEGRQNN